MCNRETPCPDKAAHGRHIHHAQQGGVKGRGRETRKTQAQLYSFPPALPREWVESMREL